MCTLAIFLLVAVSAAKPEDSEASVRESTCVTAASDCAQSHTDEAQTSMLQRRTPTRHAHGIPEEGDNFTLVSNEAMKSRGNTSHNAQPVRAPTMVERGSELVGGNSTLASNGTPHSLASRSPQQQPANLAKAGALSQMPVPSATNSLTEKPVKHGPPAGALGVRNVTMAFAATKLQPDHTPSPLDQWQLQNQTLVPEHTKKDVDPGEHLGAAVSGPAQWIAKESQDEPLTYQMHAPNLTATSRMTAAWSTFEASLQHLGISRAAGVVYYPNTHVSSRAWTLLVCTSIVLILVDSAVFRRLPNTRWSNTMVLVFWVWLGMVYNAYIALSYGWDAGYQWATGYILEWLLSMDNLFVFHVVFRVYRTPPHLIHQALFYGILGALLFRGLAFHFLGSVMRTLIWLKCTVGLVLVYFGFCGCLQPEQEIEADDVANSRAVRMLEWCLGDRLQGGNYDGEGRLFMFDPRGRLCVSLFAFVVLTLELTDAIFALDSTSAKLALIPNVYIAFSSSAVAMFGLRAMFFIILEMSEVCSSLEFGMCVILLFIGLQLLGSPWVNVGPGISLMFIGSILGVCLASSRLQRDIHK